LLLRYRINTKWEIPCIKLYFQYYFRVKELLSRRRSATLDDALIAMTSLAQNRGLPADFLFNAFWC